MQLNFSQQIEQLLLSRAASSGKSLEDVVLEAVTEKLLAKTDEDQATFEEWEKHLQEFVDLHPRVSQPVDDSRESIYEGRGQ